MSNLYKAQHAEARTEKAVSGPLRYTDTCIFWIQCDQQGKYRLLEKAVSGPLRYTDTCIFWIQCDQQGKYRQVYSQCSNTIQYNVLMPMSNPYKAQHAETETEKAEWAAEIHRYMYFLDTM